MGAQEAAEAKAAAEVAARRAERMLALARKAAGEAQAARALAEAERAEKAEFQAAKARVRALPPQSTFSAQTCMTSLDFSDTGHHAGWSAETGGLSGSAFGVPGRGS